MKLVRDASWCWFGDPRVVQYDGKVYYGYADVGGGVWVVKVDPATGARRRFRLGTSDPDDHSNPSILIKGGRIVVFWCGHSGPAMNYRISNDAEDVSSFGDTIAAATGNTPGNNGFTYPNVALMPHDNLVYLLWRGGNFQPTFSKATYLTGNDWTPAKHLLSAPRGVRPYVKMFPDPNGAWIHLLTTDGHPRDVQTDIYYAGWRLIDNTLRRADGTVIESVDTAPIPVGNLDLVYNASGRPRSWVWDLFVAGGTRYAAFATFPASPGRHEYWAARRANEDSAWTVRKVCDAGPSIAEDRETDYSGGITIDPLDPDRLVLSRPANGRPGLHRLEEWRTSDNGNSWAFSQALTDDEEQNVRPYFARFGDASADPYRLFWLRGHYRDFLDVRLDLHAR